MSFLALTPFAPIAAGQPAAQVVDVELDVVHHAARARISVDVVAVASRVCASRASIQRVLPVVVLVEADGGDNARQRRSRRRAPWLIGISRRRCSRMIALGFGSSRTCRCRRPSGMLFHRLVTMDSFESARFRPAMPETKHLLRHVHPGAIGRRRAGTLNLDLDVATKHGLVVIALVDAAWQVGRRPGQPTPASHSYQAARRVSGGSTRRSRGMTEPAPGEQERADCPASRSAVAESPPPYRREECAPPTCRRTAGRRRAVEPCSRSSSAAAGGSGLPGPLPATPAADRDAARRCGRYGCCSHRCRQKATSTSGSFWTLGSLVTRLPSLRARLR